MLSGCSGAPSTPQTAANAYLAAWGKQDWAVMRQLTSDPPADFTSANQAAFNHLTVRRAVIAAGTMRTSVESAGGSLVSRRIAAQSCLSQAAR